MLRECKIYWEFFQYKKLFLNTLLSFLFYLDKYVKLSLYKFVQLFSHFFSVCITFVDFFKYHEMTHE